MAAVITYRDTYTKKIIPVSDKFYRELTQKTSSYNAHLSSERKMRLPFLDSQTGVAQNHSSLWHPYRCRGAGEKGGQIYSYPAKRWKKKKRSFPLPEVRLTKLTDIETGEADMHQISAVENPAAALSAKPEDSKDSMPSYDETYIKEPYSYQYYDDWDQISEPPDAGEIDARHSDSSDFEDTYIKKRKKKITKSKGGRGKKKESFQGVVDDSEKPYACDQCGARYKTRPGLSYHVTHSHNNPKKKDSFPKEQQIHNMPQQQPPQQYPMAQAQHMPPPHTQAPHLAPPGPPMDHQPDQQQPHMGGYDGTDPEIPQLELLGGKSRPVTSRAPPLTPAVPPAATNQKEASKYCDFCLGDVQQNKKTGLREDLVSCADCGRSGHPSCLQFTPNMIISVKKYPWQCIECKSCGLCGTSDNDDQLLFCDDCDRGYHMYCLKPPLSEPPEGSWSCHLCIEEFYQGKKPDPVPDTTHL